MVLPAPMFPAIAMCLILLLFRHDNVRVTQSIRLQPLSDRKALDDNLKFTIYLIIS